jgi:gamma-glutamyltranspeptidase/glutathione hydrolase
VDVAFTPESSQAFRIGAASCAVPGAAAGLGEAHRLFGTLPWRVLLEPAIRHAREGVVMTKSQAYLHAILDLILRHTTEGRAIYGRDGNRLVAGDRLVMSDLAGTLERLAERGADDLYRGELARRIAAHIREQARSPARPGRYRAIRRAGRARASGHEFDRGPPPSAAACSSGSASASSLAPGRREAPTIRSSSRSREQAARDEAFARGLLPGRPGGAAAQTACGKRR